MIACVSSIPPLSADYLFSRDFFYYYFVGPSFGSGNHRRLSRLCCMSRLQEDVRNNVAMGCSFVAGVGLLAKKKLAQTTILKRKKGQMAHGNGRHAGHAKKLCYLRGFIGDGRRICQTYGTTSRELYILNGPRVRPHKKKMICFGACLFL